MKFMVFLLVCYFATVAYAAPTNDKAELFDLSWPCTWGCTVYNACKIKNYDKDASFCEEKRPKKCICDNFGK